MKKLGAIIIVLLFVLSGCVETIENSADDIRNNQWSMSSKNGKNITLEFAEDIAKFKVETQNKDSDVLLKGLGVIDKDTIVISNEYDKENYIFKYKLKGNKLTLIYSDEKITLLRQKSPSQ